MTGKSDLKLPPGVIQAQKKARAYSTRNLTTAGEAADKAKESIDAQFDAALQRLLAMGDEDEGETPTPPSKLSKVPPFVLEGVHAQVVEAHREVQAFIAAAKGERRTRPHWLSLLGRCGCGKTHLLKLTKAAMQDAGVPVELWVWRDVLDEIRAGRQDLMRHFQEVRVLLIDDVGAEFLGTEKALDYSLSKLCELQDARQAKWTMLTSNMLLKHIAGADERCASRLIRNGGEVVTLDKAEDYALAQYKARHNNLRK